MRAGVATTACRVACHWLCSNKAKLEGVTGERCLLSLSQLQACAGDWSLTTV